MRWRQTRPEASLNEVVGWTTPLKRPLSRCHTKLEPSPTSLRATRMASRVAISSLSLRSCE